MEEIAPPPAGEPLQWRLLTTQAVPEVATAWRSVGGYKARSISEHLFRVLQTQGWRIEASQVAHADRRRKRAAIAAKAAAVTRQLVQARAGQGGAPASLAVSPPEGRVRNALHPTLEGHTPRPKTPHPPNSLAWAAWILGRLGGWDGDPSSRPPGPITCKRGLDRFQSFAAGWLAREVCMP